MRRIALICLGVALVIIVANSLASGPHVRTPDTCYSGSDFCGPTIVR